MTELALIHDNMADLRDANTMYTFEGVGHSDEDIKAAVLREEGYELYDWRIQVWEGSWGWSPRFKWCGNHDSGFACDEEGYWHKHFSPNYGGGTPPITVVEIEPYIGGTGEVIRERG